MCSRSRRPFGTCRRIIGPANSGIVSECVCVWVLYVFCFLVITGRAYKTHGATTTTTKGCNVIISRARMCDTVFFYGKKHKVLIPPSAAGRIWRLYCCGGVLSTHNSSAQENNVIILLYIVVVVVYYTAHTICHALTTTVRPAATRWVL